MQLDIDSLFEPHTQKDKSSDRENAKMKILHKLKQYEGAKLSKIDFRTLQGVLSRNFKARE